MNALPRILWMLLASGVYILAGLVAIIGVTASGLGLLERMLILGTAAMLIWLTVRLRRRHAKLLNSPFAQP
jgi:hypothetical protein